jgi:hypothetical protein
MPSINISHNSVTRIYNNVPGGEVLDMQAGTSLQAVLEKVISNLRPQYAIGFNPSNPDENGRFRRLAAKIAADPNP